MADEPALPAAGPYVLAAPSTPHGAPAVSPAHNMHGLHSWLAFKVCIHGLLFKVRASSSSAGNSLPQVHACVATPSARMRGNTSTTQACE